MDVVQYYGSSVAYNILQRLQKAGLCMSHSYTVNLVESLGGDFDVTVREWKQVAENKMTMKQVTNIAYCHYIQYHNDNYLHIGRRKRKSPHSLYWHGGVLISTRNFTSTSTICTTVVFISGTRWHSFSVLARKLYWWSWHEHWLSPLW